MEVKPKGRPKKSPVIQELPRVNIEESLIDAEIKELSLQVDEIQAALKSINLMSIDNVDEKLDAIKKKLDITLKLPQLLSELDNLRNKSKVKSENIRGKKNISLLESGVLK